MEGLEFPSRYQPETRLGKGGGGEVWAVRDRHTRERLALKVLAADATPHEMAALVREAVTLSGLEGLGVPSVRAFGRLPGTGRPYLVRELVEGRSLQDLLNEHADGATCLDALARAAEQMTLLHRAALLHGDMKPANVIVEPSGRATLVDLGLAAPFREGGTVAPGLTPKYAAPELFDGKPLTVRAEVYALGVALGDILDASGASLGAERRAALSQVVKRATAKDPSARYPSADELAVALRNAAGLAGPSHATRALVWPIVGIEGVARRLADAAHALARGARLVLRGKAGAGRSVLLRRLAWTLGVAGKPLAWIDGALGRDESALASELGAPRSFPDLTIVVDDSDELAAPCLALLRRANEAGARVVLAGGGPLAEGATPFDVPPLEAPAAHELVRRAVPSLTDNLVRRVVEACQGLPGRLRHFVELAAERPVASDADVEELLSGIGSTHSLAPEDPLERAVFLLDRGRYNDAEAALARVTSGDELAIAVARARLALALGDTKRALDVLGGARASADERASSPLGKAWRLNLARAHLGLGEYSLAEELLEPVSREDGPLGAEALSHLGLVRSYRGDAARARELLGRAVSVAKAAGSSRHEALAEACLGSVLQRGDDLEGARAAYERAILAAEAASEAGILATAQLNLAGILKISGEIAPAILRFEAAVDMGRRSGRRATVRQALLNLANTDLYLGRIARAKSGIEALGTQRDALSPAQRAQLLGLEAELLARSSDPDGAFRAYAECAEAYDALGLSEASAEARLEGVVVAARSDRADSHALSDAVQRAVQVLGDGTAHRPLLALARASVATAAGDEVAARKELDLALSLARETGQRDFVWRALERRAEVEDAAGQAVSARRDREEALAVLEEIAARLPRDLREVFWNDPRRRTLRAAALHSLGSAPTEIWTEPNLPLLGGAVSVTSSIAQLGTTPLERRLARILEINTELLGEMNVERLAARVVDHAVEMLRAERGFLLLAGEDGKLTIHTSRARGGDAAHAEFSRSIAEQVVRTGEPVVALNAKGDERLRGFSSVHQLSLESVACVPIHSRAGSDVGALYVETRRRPGNSFEAELPTLRAFADQVAIALETAALIRENAERAAALAETNEQLEAAQAELKELLGDRTAQLKRARQKLRDARDTLYGHFGYQGLVGTSAAMRRLYALIDRVKETDVPVLITGESGTGKEVAARAVHRASARADQPFFGLNCGAVPEHLLESELFGHVRGAFTGADRERKGLFREADGGTLLLDEIGEMPAKMQTGLLRVLQERKVRPVGGAEEVPVDVRLVFATHRDLQQLVKDGKFREDLFYRIHVVELHIPALRERVEDIPPLVDHFLGIFAARYKREKRSVSREALRRLSQYSWPGNVRQLEHVLLNAWVLSDAPILEPSDFDLPDGRSFAPAAEPAAEGKREGDSRPKRSPESQHGAARRSKETTSKHRRDERERIIQALQACNWNRVQAAKISGIPRRTFYRRLREYGIQ
ncbi:MAG TPA: sigma 54-interacting transcriptional regulator [Polyangiaceae bacterium]|nr:sigma 54-interacting transcriptional regulator [Polyangiaceae bacterium]